MRTSTEIASIAKITGQEKAVELVAKAGFDAWDFTMCNMWNYNWKDRCFTMNENSPVGRDDYLKHARNLRRIGEENGIICNQSHAPFPTYISNFGEAQDCFKRAIECTAEAGGSICVIHPDCFITPEENAELYSKLLPFAKEHGVKIATENMWGWDAEKDEATPLACSPHSNFKAHLDALPDEYFVACLDIGHAEMRGTLTTAVDMVYTLGDRLEALHIHDVDLKHDNHQIPFSLNVDFEAIAKALREVNYKGWFTLEACHYLEAFDESNVVEGVQNLYNACSRFEKMVIRE